MVVKYEIGVKPKEIWGIPWGHLFIKLTSGEDAFVWRASPVFPKNVKWHDIFSGESDAGEIWVSETGATWEESDDGLAVQSDGTYNDVNSYSYRTLWVGSGTQQEIVNGVIAIKNALDAEAASINQGPYPYNYLYQNSNSAVGAMLGAAGLPKHLPNDGLWTPGFLSSIEENPYQGDGLTLIPFLLFEAAQFFFQIGQDIVSVLKQSYEGITDWVTKISEDEEIDPTDFAIVLDDMLEVFLELEKNIEVAIQLGSEDANTIIADQANGWLLGGAGNDTFQFNNSGNDTMIGGEGIDLASFLTSDIGLTIDLENEYSSAVSGVFKDTLLEIENVVGTDFADIVRGTSGSNTITGGKGDDTLSSRGGTDTFIHALGDGNDDLFGFAGDLSEVIMEFANPDDMYLNVYNQDMQVTNGATGEKIILRDQWSDTVNGFEFSTLNGMDITSGLTVRGTSPIAAENVYGTANADTIDGGLGDDSLYGQGGSDIFIHDVGDGSDQLFEVEGAQATVQMNGVAANDLYFNVYLEDLILTDIATGEQLTLNNQYANPDAVKEFSSVNGIDVNYGLVIKGTSATLGEVIHGTKYADTIIGGLGDDIIYGMGAADTFIHNTGDGSDYLHAQSLNELATVTLSASVADIEFNVIGGDLRVTDTTSGNVLFLKNQYLNETSGYEFNFVNSIDVTGGLEISGTGNLFGTSHNDTLEGNWTNQTIKGDDGDDVFISSGGLDHLWGQGGNDTFIFDDVTDSTTSQSDHIWQFVRGEDKVDFSQISTIDDISDITINTYGGSTYVDDVNSSFRFWFKSVTGIDATDFIFS